MLYKVQCTLRRERLSRFACPFAFSSSLRTMNVFWLFYRLVITERIEWAINYELSRNMTDRSYAHVHKPSSVSEFWSYSFKDDYSVPSANLSLSATRPDTNDDK